MQRGDRVADLAWGFPDFNRVKALGVVGILGYFCTVDASKVFGPDRIAAAHGAGLGIGYVFENGVGDVLGDGTSKGAYDTNARYGEQARRFADSVGYTLPMFRAVDFDIQPGEWAVAASGLDGFATGYGHDKALYSGRTFMERMFADGHTQWGWQTTAWSHGISGTADVYQNGVQYQVDGVTLDENIVERDRFQLWLPAHSQPPQPPAPPLPLPPVQTYPGASMTRHPLSIGPLDGAGNGYNDLAVNFDSVVALFSNGADPQTGGHYTTIPSLAASAEGSGTRVELEGGQPGGTYLVFVTSAA